jgi:4-amino-4-deoxy-L-arabinose transferase-like glycosyltransferase
VIVLAINPFIVRYSGEVATELPYTFLSVVCLYGLIRWEDERGHRGGTSAWLVMAIAAMLGAALTRTVGIALIAAVVTWLLLERRWRIAAVVSVAAAATFGVWLLWTVLAPEQFVGRSYVADVMVNPGGRPFLMTIFARIVANTLAYVQGIPWALAVPTIQGTIADNIVGLLIVGITLMAGFWVLWRQWRQPALYAVTYGLVVLVFAWRTTRFLIPMLVLMVPCVLVGALSIARSFRPRWANATLGVFVLLLTGGGALRSAELVASNNCPRTEGIPVAECAWWPEQARYFDALRFIQAKLPKDAVILTAKSGALYYYTGHKSISFAGARVQHPDNFVAWLKTQGASHILLTSLADPERRLLPSLHANCRQMRVVTSYTPTTLLLAIDAQVDAASSENDPEGDACAAVDSYQALMRVWDVEG